MTSLTNQDFQEKAFNHPLTKEVIKTLIYADIFSYPLTAREIHQNLTFKVAQENEINAILSTLCQEKIIYQHDFFYSLKQEGSIAEQRQSKNKRAIRYLKWAKFISRFIASFPFVKSVCLSGSLSKDCMDKGGDIDYFIITAPGRLWVARSLLIFFKKVALLNSYKFFCLNYFVDSDHLKIKHKNIFTATEIVTLVPTYGKEYYQEFLSENPWAKSFRPNFPERSVTDVLNSRRPLMKRFFEWCLNGKMGDRLERKFHEITAKHWQKKFKTVSAQDLEISIQSTKHASQINPENFQKRVIKAFEEKIKAFEVEHMVEIN